MASKSSCLGVEMFIEEAMSKGGGVGQEDSQGGDCEASAAVWGHV